MMDIELKLKSKSRLVFALFLVALLTSPATLMLAQTPDEQPEKPHARSPKDIVFQNDSQWEDNRWQKTDIGPFLGGTIATGKPLTLQGLAIRVGDQGKAAICFDTARMRISSGWTGDFLKFDGRRFGLIKPPAAAGTQFFATSKLAGWAKEDRFKPTPHEIGSPKDSGGNGKPSAAETRLPKDWVHYKGHYTSGNRVVLTYTVGNTKVLESPWYFRSGKNDAFTRSLEVGPSMTTHRMLISDSDCTVAIINDGDVSLENEGQQKVLVIPPHQDLIRVKVLIAKKGIDQQTIERLRGVAGKAEELSQMIQNDTGRWPDVLVTQGESNETGSSYVIDTITLPFENPWSVLFFTAGHDFFSDGTAAICTAHGEVWTVAGVDRNLKQLSWRRFATGLHQPLGLKIVDDKIYVIGRSQVTRLHDRNGDGEADFYENFNNDMVVTPKAHDFVTCLETDQEGNFYFIHATTGVMRLSADGSTLTSVATGFRNPNGMGVSPDGMITAAPQQGTWTPESSLIVVKEGGYYGFGGPKVTDDRPTGWDLPMCFIPRKLDNSGGGQVWVESDRWGPLSGMMLHLSYGNCRMLLALTEEVDGVLQGGTIEFPTTPGDFESGVMRGRFSPHDGQLYLSGLRGWQTRAIRDGCLQRVRYNGGAALLPVDVKTYSNGIKLTFSEKLDEEFVENPGNYFVEQWNYKYSKDYGSPDFSVKNPDQQGHDEVPVVSATSMDNSYAVFLEMPGRTPVNQIEISWLLRSDKGNRFRGLFAHTINSVPRETIPNAAIVRRERHRYVTADEEKQLKAGLKFAFQSSATGESDYRTGRLVALNHPIENSPTPFLPAGAFQTTITGTLRSPLSGFYDFKIEGNDQVQFWINNELILNTSESKVTPQSVLLHKGHNRIRISHASPETGRARFSLLWKGHNFGWEPVPPNVLFHDSGAENLVSAEERRLGRELFADHRCAACHQTEAAEHSMFELSLAGPDLSAAGDRLTAQWLEDWVLSPSSFRPNTHMPAVLGTGDNAQQDASDIAAFLMNQHGKEANTGSDSEAPKVLIFKGETLYEELGCIACHHFEPPSTADEFDRLSLHYANQKYRGAALSEYLRKPWANHAAVRMPDFRLSDEEAIALAAFVRNESKGQIDAKHLAGNAARGSKLFGDKGCQQCHGIGEKLTTKAPHLSIELSGKEGGCLNDDYSSAAPRFAFSEIQRQALREFVSHDMKSLSRTDSIETSSRLFKKLQCANCHDRDGQRSHRALTIIEDGSGRIPEVLPELTWSGEKLQMNWTKSLINGELEYKSRPWLTARMPVFPAYGKVLANGLAAEHGVDPHEEVQLSIQPELVKIGNSLTFQTGLDCRQCHGVGDQQPRGDKDTKISVGINLLHIRDRMRQDAYQRFMLDPPRYDIKTKMIRLSTDGRTTKLKQVFDADAAKQFDAVWHFIQSLND